MNGLLSGLSNSQGNNACGPTKKCCNNNNNNGIFGGNGIILIIILLCFCGGFGGQGQNAGTICGCEPKHVKELCRVGGSSGCGNGGFGGGFGGDGCLWIIIIIILLFCGGRRQNRGCTNNFINIDTDEDC